MLNFWTKKRIVILSSICFLFTGFAIAEDAKITVTEQTILGFAERLYREHKFDKALVEFQRSLYYFPESEMRHSTLFKMARCYKYLGDLDNATKILNEILSGGYGNVISDRAIFELGDTYYLFGEYEDANLEFQKLFEKKGQPDIKEKAGFMLTFSYMRGDAQEKALDSVLNMQGIKGFSSENLDRLVQGVKDYSDLDRKSPVLSGILSAAIPGSGHFYISRYRDGFFALVLNGLFIACALEFFDEGYIAPGVLFSLFEMTVYSGTIFSSVSQTHKYNKFIRTDYIDNLESEIGYHSYSDFINN